MHNQDPSPFYLPLVVAPRPNCICATLGIYTGPTTPMPPSRFRPQPQTLTRQSRKLHIHFDEDSDVDADYRLFLDHLAESDGVYALEIDAGDGEVVVVRYDGEDVVVPERSGGVVESPVKFGGAVDDGYQRFLRHLKVRDGSMVLEWRPGVSIVYEAEKGFAERESRFPVGGRGDCVEMQEDEGACVVLDESAESFNFEEKLMEVLSMPYELKEHEKLLKDVTERKALRKLKHLRSMSVTYATNQKGLSYLDHHPVFAKKLEEAANPEMALNLLRGFFFWLKNLSHEGSYMPWLPSSARNDSLLASGCDVVVLATEPVSKEN